MNFLASQIMLSSFAAASSGFDSFSLFLMCQVSKTKKINKSLIPVKSIDFLDQGSSA